MNGAKYSRLFLKAALVFSWAVFFILSTLSAAREQIAVATKSKGSAELRPFEGKEFKRIVAGTGLFNKDFIRTGSDGFLVLVYLDDKTMLKIKRNTDVEIHGTRVAEGISKKIDMTAGTLKAEVAKRRGGEFVISTPTSVASVKGTIFYLTSDLATGDRVFGIEGVVELMNLISGYIVQVLPNQTAISLRDGSVNVGATNPSEIPKFEEEAEGEIKELRIRFRDPEGREKELIINYR